jgi:hypothetical protein
MTVESLLVLAVVLVVAYYTVRRWVVLNIFSGLVAGTLASPLRTEQIKKLVARRIELEESLEISEEERDRRLKEVEEYLAQRDPECMRGRENLWHTAWEIYRECPWTKPKLN